MTTPIATSLLPSEVRAGGARAHQLYASALDFERLLTTELTKSLASALGGDDDATEDDGSTGSGDGVTGGSSGGALSQLTGQLPAMLADAVQQGGGLGLAPVLYRSLARADGGGA